MGIFRKEKEEEVLNEETILKKKRIESIKMGALKVGCGIGLAFNGIMMFMLMIRASPLSFLFLINSFFLIQTWKRGFSVES